VQTTRRSGYTLFELILVVAVMGIVAALAVPLIGTMYGDKKLTAAADMVRARWADARSRAAEEGRPYRFEVTPGTGKFRLVPHDDQTGGDATTSDDAPPIEGELPGEVKFSTEGLTSGSSGSTDSSSNGIVFRPNGTADADSTITFTAPGSRPLVLTLRATTGCVTCEHSDMGE
jgi:type II secretion system protein H